MRRLLVVIAVLLAGSAWAVTPGQRTILFSGIKPVFQVDLTALSSLPSQITQTRASNGTYFDATGVLQTASTNVARFDHSPTTPFAPLGLLIEETRTNVVLRNRDLSNASWTKTNVTAALDQTGIDGAANSASSITATAGNGTALQAITLASSQRFQSAYVQRITGSGVVNMTTDGGATWTAITIPGAGTWGRVSIPAQTLANPSVGFRIVTNGDAIAVDFVQNETGAFATSAIATTTTSVVRSADVTQLTGTAFAALQGTSGTVFVQTTDSSQTTSILLSSTTSTLVLYVSGNTLTAANGVITTGDGSYVWTAPVRAGLSWSSTGVSLGANGATPTISAATTAGIGSITAPFYLGQRSLSVSWLDGHVALLVIYNQRLSDAVMKAKSVVGAPF